MLWSVQLVGSWRSPVLFLTTISRGVGLKANDVILIHDDHVITFPGPIWQFLQTLSLWLSFTNVGSLLREYGMGHRFTTMLDLTPYTFFVRIFRSTKVCTAYIRPYTPETRLFSMMGPYNIFHEGCIEWYIYNFNRETHILDTSSCTSSYHPIPLRFISPKLETKRIVLNILAQRGLARTLIRVVLILTTGALKGKASYICILWDTVPGRNQKDLRQICYSLCVTNYLGTRSCV